jgi:ankyrin repeat protein
VTTSPSRRRLVAVLAAAWALAGSRAEAGDVEDFFKAVELDNPRWLRGLLDAGVDPNTVDDQGQGALFLAMRDGCFAVAEVLLVRPDLEVDRANARGETPLMMAALRGHLAWVPQLVARGATVNRVGWTPLHYAASGPEPKVLALLLQAGASIDAPSASGTTALMMAAGYGAIDGARWLLAHGADARLRNRAGLDAAAFARRAGREALAEELARAVR